jgi:hypothetical protein
MDKDTLLEKIVRKYLSSEEFNGLPIHSFESEKKALIRLIKEGKIAINFGDNHPNPHIKALKLDPKAVQLTKLDSLGVENAVAYPAKKVLQNAVDQSKYVGKPFTLALALGEPQLNYASFDLSVLEFYRNDPRYYYVTNDISGMICIDDKYYRSMRVKPSDKIALQTFGFCYDRKKNRAVAVYYIYLSKLSPEHQQIWNQKRLHKKFWIHPDYARNTAGYFGEKESIFTAFVAELETINAFSELMGRPALFRNSYKENKPKEFGFLVRPTLKEYNDFIHVLDIMISDNINKDFFQNDIPYEREVTRKDNKVVVETKGTIALLDEWLNLKFRFADPIPKDEMIATFKLIRQMRNFPAHNLDDNKISQRYIRKQRELAIQAYGSIRTLRMILANAQRTKAYKVPEWLYKGEIWTF